MKYNKLVRDKIVGKLEFDKQIVSYHNIDVPAQRLPVLIDKLQEERNELIEAITNKGDVLDEIADVMEVLYAIGTHFGFSKRQIGLARRKKALRLGTFKHFFYLHTVEKPDEN